MSWLIPRAPSVHHEKTKGVHGGICLAFLSGQSVCILITDDDVQPTEEPDLTVMVSAGCLYD